MIEDATLHANEPSFIRRALTAPVGSRHSHLKRELLMHGEEANHQTDQILKVDVDVTKDPVGYSSAKSLRHMLSRRKHTIPTHEMTQDIHPVLEAKHQHHLWTQRLPNVLKRPITATRKPVVTDHNFIDDYSAQHHADVREAARHAQYPKATVTSLDFDALVANASTSRTKRTTVMDHSHIRDRAMGHEQAQFRTDQKKLDLHNAIENNICTMETIEFQKLKDSHTTRAAMHHQPRPHALVTQPPKDVVVFGVVDNDGDWRGRPRRRLE